MQNKPDVRAISGGDIADQLTENLKARFREQLSGLIPDHAWELLLTNVIQDFFEREFKTIVESLLKEEIRKKVDEFFKSPDWQGRWDYNQPTVGDYQVDELMVVKPGKFVEQFILENAEKFTQALIMQMMGASIQRSINGAHSMIQNNRM